MDLALCEPAIKLGVRHQVVLEVAELAGASYRYIARAQRILQLSHDTEFVKATVDAFRTEHIRLPTSANEA